MGQLERTGMSENYSRALATVGVIRTRPLWPRKYPSLLRI
jgi:hypothetical protein